MSHSEIREIELPGGEKFFVEVTAPGIRDVRGSMANPVSWASLEHQITAVSRSVLSSVYDALPGTPSRWGVEFGVKLTAETGTLLGVLAKVSGESTIVVRAEWEPKPSKDGN